MTHKSRNGRRRRVGQRVQLGYVLAYALAHTQSSTGEITEHYGLTKSRIWTILNEVHLTSGMQVDKCLVRNVRMPTKID